MAERLGEIDRRAAGFESFADFYRASDYAPFPQEHRSGGTMGVAMMDVRQDAVETVDPAIDQWAFVACRHASTEAIGELDFGDGWRRTALMRGFVDPQPANTECRFRIPAVHLLVFVVDRATLAARLAEVGAAPAALEAVAGTLEPMPRALALMEQAWAASEATGPAANLLVDAAISGVVCMMLARQGGRLDAPPRLDDRRLARVVEYVEAHLSEPMTAGDLASVAHVSLFHFTRIFRDATGRTPHAYVQARRVARAKSMLRGPMPLTQVAMACGFASQSHFGQVFRAHAGATPGQWRRALT